MDQFASPHVRSRAGDVEFADPEFGDEDLPANKTTLSQVVEDTGKKPINYVYDFGDNWQHKIKIGKIIDPALGELYPILTEVTGKCLPEDVDGFPGYEHFLEAIADPKHTGTMNSWNSTATLLIPTSLKPMSPAKRPQPCQTLKPRK